MNCKRCGREIVGNIQRYCNACKREIHKNDLTKKQEELQIQEVEVSSEEINEFKKKVKKIEGIKEFQKKIQEVEEIKKEEVEDELEEEVEDKKHSFIRVIGYIFLTLTIIIMTFIISSIVGFKLGPMLTF